MGPVRRRETSRVGGRELSWCGSSSVIPCNLMQTRTGVARIIKPTAAVVAPQAQCLQHPIFPTGSRKTSPHAGQAGGGLAQKVREASCIVLAGFELGTDAKIVRYPDRYMDERGVVMWGRVMELIHEQQQKTAA